MNVKGLKILGLVVSGICAVGSVVASIISDKQQDIKIKDAAAEAVANIMKGES